MSTPNTVPAAILAIRLSINDSATSNYAGPDNLEAQVDGLRKVFKLSNKNIVAGASSAFYVADSGTPVTADPTDPVNGLSILATAPQASFEYYYYYQKFIDAEIQQFLDTGLGKVGMTETTLTTIDQGLWDVVSHYASAEAYHTLMGRFAETFTTSVEGESYTMSDIFKSYRILHDTHIEDGDKMREEYYKKQGRRFQTYSTSTSARQPLNPLLPRR